MLDRPTWWNDYNIQHASEILKSELKNIPLSRDEQILKDTWQGFLDANDYQSYEDFTQLLTEENIAGQQLTFRQTTYQIPKNWRSFQDGVFFNSGSKLYNALNRSLQNLDLATLKDNVAEVEALLNPGKEEKKSEPDVLQQKIEELLTDPYIPKNVRQWLELTYLPFFFTRTYEADKTSSNFNERFKEFFIDKIDENGKEHLKDTTEWQSILKILKTNQQIGKIIIDEYIYQRALYYLEKNNYGKKLESDHVNDLENFRHMFTHNAFFENLSTENFPFISRYSLKQGVARVNEEEVREILSNRLILSDSLILPVYRTFESFYKMLKIKNTVQTVPAETKEDKVSSTPNKLDLELPQVTPTSSEVKLSRMQRIKKWWQELPWWKKALGVLAFALVVAIACTGVGLISEGIAGGVAGLTGAAVYTLAGTALSGAVIGSASAALGTMATVIGSAITMLGALFIGTLGVLWLNRFTKTTPTISPKEKAEAKETKPQLIDDEGTKALRRVSVSNPDQFTSTPDVAPTNTLKPLYKQNKQDSSTDLNRMDDAEVPASGMRRDH